ncbi:MAG TPA: type II CAAX endopeptidase family protein [Chthoniobacterales bacterium]|nr:type II CAAX endopeptidase family protein [Chthoniobacterales bacterium]
MPEGISTAVAAVTNALFLVGGIYIYLALTRQIAARKPAAVEENTRSFGLADLVLALGLATLFLLNAVIASSRTGKMVMETNDLIANALISLGLFVFVAAFLKVRGFSVTALAGFARLSFWRGLMTGIILLFAAYPLIYVADLLTQRVLGTPSTKQGIVDLFNDSQTLQQRVLIIILAVAIAPLVEEFVFRFFIYGVVRRYLGRFVGLLANSILFAAVHAHLPSAAPLFVLGSCFTLAYEWSGSILVTMTMHALFNSLTLTALAFPELIQQ